MVIIQYVSIVYNKKYRGGEGAQIRTQLPKAYELPIEICVNNEPDKVLIHHVYRPYNKNFEVKEFVKELNYTTRKYGAIKVKEDGDNIDVHFSYSEQYCGKPIRGYYSDCGKFIPREEEAFRLLSGEVGRLEFNGRYIGYDSGSWWYEHKIVNILNSNNFHKNVFVDAKPIKLYKSMEDLH